MFIYRGQGMLLRGQNVPGGLFYAAYHGSENLNEPLNIDDITGTLALSTASSTIIGTGTLFQDQLHTGQMLYFGDCRNLVVKDIISQTEMTVWLPPTVNDATATAFRVPNLFALDTKRASLFWGNAVLTDKGNIVAVGDGALQLNGDELAGESLYAERRAQIALYDSAGNTYSVEDIGFDVEPNTANTAITVVGSGGTKNMSAGYYSFRIAYYSDITNGYSNLCTPGAYRLPFGG